MSKRKPYTHGRGRRPILQCLAIRGVALTTHIRIELQTSQRAVSDAQGQNIGLIIPVAETGRLHRPVLYKL
ncbi:MAG: hypothetical protein V4637_15135, partial [Pseudomonadota bacterium]